jgi:hypothetical protein
LRGSGRRGRPFRCVWRVCHYWLTIYGEEISQGEVLITPSNLNGSCRRKSHRHLNIIYRRRE